MGFFQTFSSWLDGQLASYIGTNTVRVAGVLEPALVSLATVYIMIWGYLQLTGQVEEPFMAGLKRLMRLAFVFGVAIQLWLYNSVIVDTFYQAPTQLAAAVIGSPDPVATLDAIWDSGGTAAGNLWSNGGLLGGDAGFYIAGLAIWVLVGGLCTYTMFLFALSRVALSVLLALGPLFIMLALFDSTRRYMEAWLAQLATYGFISILTALVAALMLRLVQSYAVQTAARGTSIATVDVLNLALVTVLAFLFMRQVTTIAASLGAGTPLQSHGLVGRSLSWGWTHAMGLSGLAAAAAMDGPGLEPGRVPPKVSTMGKP
jgi:type IV secretion system protein VirB6